MRKYRTAAAFRMALEARMAEHARQTIVPIGRVRKAVMFERLLARLQAVAPGHCLLKGALALDFRFGARATNDMDLACAHDAESATAELMAAAAYDADDYFTFIMEQTDRLNALEETFAQRGKQPLPATVPPPPPGWGPGYRKMATTVGIDPDVSQGYARAAAFLDPVLAAKPLESRWDHLAQQWVRQGEQG